MDLEAAVLGGAIFGGGGGGSISSARSLGLQALESGEPRLASIEDVPADGLLLTLSLVGAPSRESGVSPADDLIRAAERMMERLGQECVGFIASEVGAGGMVLCWPAAVRLGLPVVDAPTNGRAHPIGAMGSMGLAADPHFQSRQAVVGQAGGDRFEMTVEGTIDKVDPIVRRAAALGSGLVAVARNPVPASYVRAHAACGAMRRALEIGAAAQARQAQGARAVAEEIRSRLGATVLFEARVASRHESTAREAEGLDAGTVVLEASNGRQLELTYWNEYMTLDQIDGGRERLATFPDLIVTLDAASGLPFGSAEVVAGRCLFVVAVPRGRLLLGSGVKDPLQLSRVEKVVGREVLGYLGRIG